MLSFLLEPNIEHGPDLIHECKCFLYFLLGVRFTFKNILYISNHRLRFVKPARKIQKYKSKQKSMSAVQI